MSNDDFRNELNRAFDGVAGTPSSNLRDRVRAAVAHAPQRREPYWIAGVAACVIAALIIGVLFVANPLKRPSPAGGGVLPSPTTTTSPATPTAVQSLVPVEQFNCAATTVLQNLQSGAATTPPVVNISAVRTGTHAPAYDRVTIEFANGIPAPIEIRPQTGTTFTLSPSGMQTTVKGNQGVLIIIHGADMHTAYSGPNDVVTGYKGLAEVKRIEDFEGVVQVALGVNGQGCFRSMVLTNPYRLVIDVPAS